jgi:uncharacterized membrane protein YqjE
MDKSRNKYYNITLDNDANTSKEIRLNAIDSSVLSESNIFHIKSEGIIKTTVNLSNFKVRHCKRIKSVSLNGKRYTGLYKPKDDTHAFYIPAVSGKFINKAGKFKDIIDPLLTRLNDISDIERLNHTFTKIGRLKKLFILMIFIVAMLMGLFCLLTIYIFMLWSVNAQHTGSELIFTVCTYIALFGLAYVFYKLITSNNKRIKYLCFHQLNKKRKELESEIENWNEKVLNNENMKAQLADTFDYIQVFSNRHFVYIIDDKF